MNSGKIIGLLFSGFIVLIFLYMLVQEGTSTPQTKKPEVDSSIKKESFIPLKSEEEQKLEELKQQSASSLNNSVSELYMVRCKACHGSDGQGSKVGPSLKGKSTEYILSKLDDYKNNRVTNSLMQGLLTNVSQEELNALAQEISNFK